MHLQSRLLSAAILAALAVAAPAFAAKSDHPAAGRALGLIDANKAATHRADADRFQIRDVIVDTDGTEHVRVSRSYRGLPVIFGDMVVHSKNGQFKSASQTLATKERPAVAPRLNADEAIVEAGTAFGTGFKGVPTASLVVYARGAKPVLAYEVRFNGAKADQTPTDMHYYVDAKSGAILDRWDMVHTADAVGTGNTISAGTVSLNTNSITGGYELKDTTRGNGYTQDHNNQSTTITTGTNFFDADNVWGNGANSDRASAAAEAHYGVALTWDYFKNVHARNGIRNDGVGAKSLVHVGTNWVNASWSSGCFCMRYGDGDGVTYRPLTVIDVAGHEMAHGVTGATAGLAYSADAGGLNESTSDIFGTMVEYYANNASDGGDYLLGEKIYISNPNGTKALRVMFKQNLDGKSYVCYPSRGFNSSPKSDPHYTSGVGNRFFYLLAEGTVVPASHSTLAKSDLVCNGDTDIVGIGRTKAEKIWYKALSTYMTSGTTYPGARAATLSAAQDLYGLNSAEYNTVAEAWNAVLVN